MNAKKATPAAIRVDVVFSRLSSVPLPEAERQARLHHFRLLRRGRLKVELSLLAAVRASSAGLRTSVLRGMSSRFGPLGPLDATVERTNAARSKRECRTVSQSRGTARPVTEKADTYHPAFNVASCNRVQLSRRLPQPCGGGTHASRSMPFPDRSLMPSFFADAYRMLASVTLSPDTEYGSR
jgi:hypothetical protein